jgi:hypothetical protein
VSAFAAELVALVPWDDEQQGVPSRFIDHPMFSWGVPGQTRRVRAPVRLRLDRDGGLHLAADGSGIVHLAADGSSLGRTPLAERRGPLTDYACDADGDCAVLEEGGRLRGVDRGGGERWSVETAATKLLSTGDRLYLPIAQGLDELDARSGARLRTLPRRAGAGEPFLGGGRIVSRFFDDQRELRGIEALDPDGDAEELAGGEKHYAWLVHPFGADARSRLYVWRDAQVGRVGVDGAIEVLGAVEGIAVKDGAVYTSRPTAGGVVVTGPDGDATLAAPPEHRLISIDPSGRYHLMGGEAPDSAGELRTYGADGQLEATAPAPEDLAGIDCRVPGFRAWQVAPDGRIVIPVVTPEGVAVVGLDRRQAR